MQEDCGLLKGYVLVTLAGHEAQAAPSGFVPALARALRFYFPGNLRADLISSRGVFVVPESHRYEPEGTHRLH